MGSMTYNQGTADCAPKQLTDIDIAMYTHTVYVRFLKMT